MESAVADAGVSGVALRDVARRAGVSHGAPAHHFGSKAGMLTAFATAGYWLMAQSVIDEVAASHPADGPAELAAIGRGYVRFAVGHPAHFEVMFRLDALNPAELVAVSAWSIVHGLSALWISGRLAERITEQDPRRLAAAVSDLFVEAVLPEKA